MRIEFLFTFGSKPQERVEYPFVNPILKDKQTLFDFATGQLYPDEKADLVKISSCVLVEDGDVEEVQWFLDSGGKLYVENGKLI